MKNQTNPQPLETYQNGMDLYSIVKNISVNSLPSAIKKQSFIINDVPKGLEVTSNVSMLSAVISNLLNTIIGNTANSCIRISARLFGTVILLHLKESHSGGQAFVVNLRQVQQLAERIGGTVSINSDRNEATKIVFSFINTVPLAA